MIGGCKTEVSKVSVGDYVWNRAKIYKKGTIKDSSFDVIEKTIKDHIVPEIGMIQLRALTADAIQQLIYAMKDKKGCSHSTVKKVYDCLRQILSHAK